MHRSIWATAALFGVVIASNNTSLADLCTASHIRSALPANGTLLGINLIPSSVTASPVYNATTGASGQNAGGTGTGSGTSGTSQTYSYCNVTLSYTHSGKNDNVELKLAFPSPADFQTRWYVAGGGGFSLSSDATGGLPYGAAGGATSAGYDAFQKSYDEVVLYGNGSINWDATHAFGYTALGELTQVGKYVTSHLYNLSNGTKLYSYFEGCSDGGREAMSQVQRWGAEYDGVVAGAPAFRFAQQQVLHVLSSEIEHTLNYYPPPCALDRIVNATIAACDPLDGKTDGVVSRTDLCMLHFNLSSLIGKSYYCAAESASSGRAGGVTGGAPGKVKRQMGGGASAYAPAQNGSITAKDVAVAKGIYNGLFNSKGQRAYLSWQIGSALSDATTTWDNSSHSWTLSIPSIGGEYVRKWVQLLNLTNLANLDGVTPDTLVDWMDIGMIRYLDSLQTTLPDLTPFQPGGGKLLHYHGESDPSIPAASSVHYWQSVRSIMYPHLSETEAERVMQDWYQLYLVPGAAHCGANSLQPDGPFPESNMKTMIDWVENGVKPTRLNATIQGGTQKGEIELLCQWPNRPLWHNNSSSPACERNQASIDTWTYSFPAFKLPVY